MNKHKSDALKLLVGTQKTHIPKDNLNAWRDRLCEHYDN